MSDISRLVVLDLLGRWERGELSPPLVLEEAEAALDGAGWPEFPESDPRSIPIEVMSHLEVLNHQFLTVEDVPAMRRFLETPDGLEPEGWNSWVRYLDGIELASRKAALSQDPFYGSP